MGLFSRKRPTPTPEERGYDTFFDSVRNGRYSNDGSVQGISAVFAAINLISNALASLPIVVKCENEVLTNHNVCKLFRTNIMTKFMMIKSLVQDAIIYGAGYCYICRDDRGEPTKLIYCEPNQVTSIYNSQSHEQHFLCPSAAKGDIDPHDMLVIYNQTRNGVEGVSIIKYAKKIFDLCKYTDSAASDFYSSGCNLNGVLTVSGQPNQTEIENIRTQWRSLHSGDGASGLAILRGNMKYESIGVSSADSQMLESRQFNVTEVARFFNINPTLLGDLSHTSYNSIEQSMIQFVTLTLLPYIVMIEEELSRKLLMDEEYDCSIDLDENVLLRTDKSALANYLNTLVSAGIITRNEARRMLGLSAVEGGDSLIVAYTKIEDNTIGSTDSEDVTDVNN